MIINRKTAFVPDAAPAGITPKQILAHSILNDKSTNIWQKLSKLEDLDARYGGPKSATLLDLPDMSKMPNYRGITPSIGDEPPKKIKSTSDAPATASIKNSFTYLNQPNAAIPQGSAETGTAPSQPKSWVDDNKDNWKKLLPDKNEEKASPEYPWQKKAFDSFFQDLFALKSQKALEPLTGGTKGNVIPNYPGLDSNHGQKVYPPGSKEIRTVEDLINSYIYYMPYQNNTGNTSEDSDVEAESQKYDEYLKKKQAINSINKLDPLEKRQILEHLDDEYGIFNIPIIDPDGAPDEQGVNPKTGKLNVGGYDLANEDYLLLSDLYNMYEFPPEKCKQIFIKVKQSDGKITADDIYKMGLTSNLDNADTTALLINTGYRLNKLDYTWDDLDINEKQQHINEAWNIISFATMSGNPKEFFGFDGKKKSSGISKAVEKELPSGKTVAGENEVKPNNQPIKYQRTQAEHDDLATDPGIGGKITDKTKRERDVGLGVESTGETGKLVRDKSGAGDFVDTVNGQKWDVKGFNSNFSPERGGYTLEKSMKNINASLGKGENVIVDTLNMSPNAISELKSEIDKRGLSGVVIFWP